MSVQPIPIVISAPPPWAQSGYGVQAELTAAALTELGHRVAISAYAGVHEERDRNGIRILSTGGKPNGNGVLAANYRRWQAELLIMICDPWMVDPGQLAGLHVMPWMPIDVDKLGVMDRQWLDRARDVAASIRPVAMSQHGRSELEAAGWPSPLVPHAVHPEISYSVTRGARWRESLGIDKDAFLITKIGVNNEDDRKAFEVTLLAFAEFSARHPRARLYLHTEPQAKKAPNLAMMALELGLKGRVAFADEDKRGADLYSTADMAAIYSGTDVLDATSKGEGFGVPAIEALACATPVIGCRNSAMTEKLRPEIGWLVNGQRTWARHHNAWWCQPSVAELARAYVQASSSARSHAMRRAALAEGDRWSYPAMRDAWAEALTWPAPPADHKRVFAGIYRRGEWGNGSGPGSDPEAARPYIDFLQRYGVNHGIRTVLDLGCGDGQLARALGFSDDNPFYTGLDVTAGHDIRTCELPEADLVLIKDVLQHWSNADITAFMPRLAGYPHVLITNTISEQITGQPVNSDIAAGQWRALDIRHDPFYIDCREVLRWDLPGETKAVMELTW